MSASLVGSEMCIRDRARVDGLPRLCAARWPVGQPPLQSVGSLDERLSLCLLYTSDAADDM
eukprot:2009070-Alexandrium_andersonii.AAC.1